MPTLHLGVVDVPYTEGGKTTGDVATILEDKYGVMEFFYKHVGAYAIVRALERSSLGTIESLLLGVPAKITITAEAESEIEAMFRHFLSQREMDGKVTGVPTAAALKGINHELKHPYAKTNPVRPSFIDTEQYQASFKIWID